MTVSRREDAALLSFAVRYALGRRTYAPGLVHDALIRHYHWMYEEDVDGLIADIERQQEFGYGDDCDAETWLATLQWLREMKRRRLFPSIATASVCDATADESSLEPMTPEGAKEFVGRWLIGDAGTHDRIRYEAAQHIYTLLDQLETLAAQPDLREALLRRGLDDAIHALTHLLKQTGKHDLDDIIRRVVANTVPRLHAVLQGEDPYVG